jgi:hypothetical protein
VSRVVGRAILDDIGDESTPGLTINGAATLPFLLAARATVCAPDSRPVFAEGLASSYEAFRHTRKGEAALDEDSANDRGAPLNDASRWYLAQLDRALPLSDPAASASHPKIAATVARVLAAWRQREKVLVFCHFVRTGQTLRRVISHHLRNAIFGEAASRLGCSSEKAEDLLERLGARFFDRDSPARRACDAFSDNSSRHTAHSRRTVSYCSMLCAAFYARLHSSSAIFPSKAKLSTRPPSKLHSPTTTLQGSASAKCWGISLSFSNAVAAPASADLCWTRSTA